MCFSKKEKTTQGCTINRRKIAALPSIADHSKVLDIFIEECVKKELDETKVKNTVKAITIEWWKDIYPSPSTGNLSTVVVYQDKIYSGATTGNICRVAWRGSFARSAFAHEILHVIGANILNDDNRNHDNALLYSLEVIINAKLGDLGL